MEFHAVSHPVARKLPRKLFYAQGVFIQHYPITNFLSESRGKWSVLSIQVTLMVLLYSMKQAEQLD